MPRKYEGEEEKEPSRKKEKLFGQKANMFRALEAGDKPFRPGNPDPPHRLRRKFKYDPSKEGQN